MKYQTIIVTCTEAAAESLRQSARVQTAGGDGGGILQVLMPFHPLEKDYIATNQGSAVERMVHAAASLPNVQ